MELFYWRQGDLEVDFVLKQGDQLIAIEVKSNHERLKKTGIDRFVQAFSPSKVLLVGAEGVPVDTFLRTPVPELMAPP